MADKSARILVFEAVRDGMAPSNAAKRFGLANQVVYQWLAAAAIEAAVRAPGLKHGQKCGKCGMSDVAAIWIPIDSLKPWEKNPRRNDAAAKMLAKSLQAFAEKAGGDFRRVFIAPMAAQQKSGRIVCGHTRWKAAKAVGMTHVPVMMLDVDDQLAERMAIADNRLGEEADWDKDLLAEIMRGLPEIDRAGLGFSDEAIQRLLDAGDPDASRKTSERYEVLISCASEEDQAARLDEMIAANVDCTAITFRVAERKERPSPPENPIPQNRMEIRRAVDVRRTARVLQCAGLFDLPNPAQSVETWSVDVDLPPAWNIGLIVGPSGSGKSTLAAELLGEHIAEPNAWGAGSILDDFPAAMSIHDIVELLSSVGFSSPPAWMRPFHALSNGQQFRVTLARALADARPITVVDEFTSVVDRTVAQVGSAAVASAVRRRGQRFVAVTCHYDVAEWLCPDWVIEMPSGTLTRGSLRRPSIELEVRRVHYSAWDVFRAHHYLTADINRSAACYVAWWRGEPVTFASVIPQMASRSWRAHRSVCLPDFQGIGIGHALQAKIASMYACVGEFTMKISAPAVIAHAMRSPDWQIMGKPDRYKGSNGKGSDSPRIGASFRWCGARDQDSARAFGLVPGPDTQSSRQGGTVKDRRVSKSPVLETVNVPR